MGQTKNISILLALWGSILMMMMVSVLFFVQTPAGLRADIASAEPVSLSSSVLSSYDVQTVDTTEVSHETSSDAIDINKLYEYQESAEVLKAIQEFVENNDPDAAKKLYNAFYTEQYEQNQSMGGEVTGERT